MKLLWIWIVAIAVCPLCGLAQFGGVQQPMFSVISLNAFTPESIPGLAYYWNYTDLPTNITVTNWSDRIQGVTFTNSTVEQRPTNSETGVGFGGAHKLWIPQISQTDSNPAAYFMILRTTSLTLPRPTWGVDSVNYYLLSHDPDWAGSAGSRWVRQVTATAKLPCAGINGNLPTNELMTLTVSYGGHLGSPAYYYTNGIQSWSTNNPSKFESISNLGGNVSGFWFIGYIKELCIYTNVLSDLNVSNLHWYATNTYALIP